MENPLSKTVTGFPEWDAHRDYIIENVEGLLNTSQHGMSRKEFNEYAETVEAYMRFRFNEGQLRTLLVQYDKISKRHKSGDFMAGIETQDYLRYAEETVDKSIEAVVGGTRIVPIISKALPRDSALYDAVRRQSQDEIRGIMQEAGLRSSNGEPELMDLMNHYIGFRTDLYDFKAVQDHEKTIRSIWGNDKANDLVYSVKASAEEMIDNYLSQRGRKDVLKDKLPRNTVSLDNRNVAGRKIREMLHTNENAEQLLKAAGITQQRDRWFENEIDAAFHNPELQRRVLSHQADIYLSHRVGAKGTRKREVFEMHDFLKREYGNKADAIIKTLETQVDTAIDHVLGQKAARQSTR